VRRFWQPQVPQFAFAAGQPAADLPQTLGVAELTEQHGDELAPTGKAPGMTLGVVLLHRSSKFVAGEQLQDLGKNATYSIHGWASLVRELAFCGEFNWVWLFWNDA
jgi:hypothetical protein